MWIRIRIRIQFRSGSTSLVPTGSLHPPFRINEIVERFPNSKFGSYPSWVNQYYKTRISYECPTTQELGLLFTSLKTWDPSPLAAIRYTMMGFVLRKFFLISLSGCAMLWNVILFANMHRYTLVFSVVVLNMCIVFGSESRNLHQFGSGSGAFHTVTLSILKKKMRKYFWY